MSELLKAKRCAEKMWAGDKASKALGKPGPARVDGLKRYR